MTTRRVFCSTVRLRRQSGGTHVLGRLLSLLFLYSQYCGVPSVVSIRRIWSQNLGFYSKLWFKPTEHAWRTCWCLCPADPTGQWTGWSCCPPYWRWIWLWLWSSYDQAQAGPWRQPGQSGPSPGSGNADVYLKWDERCECIPYKNSRRSKDLCGCSDFQYKTLIIFRMDILIITGPAYQIKLGSQLSQKNEEASVLPLLISATTPPVWMERLNSSCSAAPILASETPSAAFFFPETGKFVSKNNFRSAWTTPTGGGSINCRSGVNNLRLHSHMVSYFSLTASNSGQNSV